MNEFYYNVFVDGILDLKQTIYENFEARIMVPLSDWVAKISRSFSNLIYDILEEGVIFERINNGVPYLVIGFYHRIKKTQTGMLGINLMYLILLLLAIIVGMMELGGI
jgi:hypothetical protein